MDTQDDLGASIQKALDGIEGISVFAVFGSRAGGSPRPDSDLDVAVLPEEDFVGQRRKLQARVAASLADLVPGGRVDVVFVDEVPELLRQRIMEKARILILRDARRWRELRCRTMREHGDREPYRRLLRLAQQRRLMEGNLPHGGS